MHARVAEDLVRTGLLRRKQLVRVDLHGVSLFGPSGHHRVVRWEWIESIHPRPEGVLIRCPAGDLAVPAGAFSATPEDLARTLEQARAIERRPEVIAALGRR